MSFAILFLGGLFHALAPMTLKQKIISVLIFKLCFVLTLRYVFKARKTIVTPPLLEQHLLDKGRRLPG